MNKKYCKCGCGEELDFTTGRKTKEYIKGHSSRVYNAGGISRKGKPPWNKGIPRTDEEKENISRGRSGVSPKMPAGFYEHLSKLFKGREMSWLEKYYKLPKSENHKKNISDTMKTQYKNGERVSPFYIDGRYINNQDSQYNQYNGEFTDELKQEVRKRDNWICQQCGRKRSVTCHHIDEDKLNNIKDNLITLCKSCHSKFHHPSNDREKEILTEFYIKKVILNGKN